MRTIFASNNNLSNQITIFVELNGNIVNETRLIFKLNDNLSKEMTITGIK